MTWLFEVGRLAHHLGLQLQISSLSLTNQDISEFLVRKKWEVVCNKGDKQYRCHECRSRLIYIRTKMSTTTEENDDDEITIEPSRAFTEALVEQVNKEDVQAMVELQKDM